MGPMMGYGANDGLWGHGWAMGPLMGYGVPSGLWGRGWAAIPTRVWRPTASGRRCGSGNGGRLRLRALRCRPGRTATRMWWPPTPAAPTAAPPAGRSTSPAAPRGDTQRGSV